jgi:uncharacterized glyoxalase superfamily protein PhnB
MLKMAIPVFHVSDSLVAEEFYCKGLGFTRQFSYRLDSSRNDPCYMGLARDGAVLHLSSFSGDGVPGAAVCMLVEDVDGLHAELVAKSVPIDTPPMDQTWGTREMYIRDADRNQITFQQVRPASTRTPT